MAIGVNFLALFEQKKQQLPFCHYPNLPFISFRKDQLESNFASHFCRLLVTGREFGTVIRGQNYWQL